MNRCLDLAAQGLGNTAPNPMVGAVLVHAGSIIGEGYHKGYGLMHAEAECLNSVRPENIKLIKESTLYVSLEPCSHFGKTPPCADLIIRNNIPVVIVGCADSFEKVNGSGIEKLRAAGIKVEINILQQECRNLNKRFFTFHEKKRPYIILKWAQSKDGKIGGAGGKTIKITDPFTDRLVHKWRSEESAILAGTRTVLNDDPSLTVRNRVGKNPVRVIIDSDLKIPGHAKIFDGQAKTFIMNRKRNETIGSNIFFKMIGEKTVQEHTLSFLTEHELNSVLIEGGSKTLQSFIDAGLWDEARVLTNNELLIGEGISSPALRDRELLSAEHIFSDCISIYKNCGNEFL